MPEYVNEKKIQLAVKEGYNRMARFRKARMAFIRQYVGQWYAGESVTVGDEPLNFIYHVIRSLVPNLITRNPTSRVTTEIREYATYAYLLGIGLDKLNNKINLKNIIRRAVVDSLFCMGIVKTGIAATDSLIEFGDVRVDPGQIFADNVDFDDFVADATCTTWEEAAFMGHRSRIPRQLLLDDDECDHDVVMRLPRSTSDAAKKKVSMLSQRGLSNQEMFELQDFVDIVELWIPGAGASIIIPDPDQYMSNGYIKIQDFYGPATGPYHILSLTQPVPGNPFPIAPVGIWYDLHIMANRLMKKQMERADAQKTLFVADPAAADQVDDMREAPDGEIIYGNPDNVTVVSTPGAERGTSDSLSNIQVWLNYLSGNTDQTAGISSASETATQATILEANANVGIEDSRGMIYDFTAGINSDFGWFMHYDPFLEIPLTVRDSERGERMPDGLVPGQSLRLTPQQRRGEHYHYAFTVKPRSMGSLDPMLMAKRVIDFATNIVPALIMAAASAQQMGLPFNAMRAITDLADQLEIGDSVKQWFDDPEFMQRLELVSQLGPQPEGKAGLSMQGVRQNGGSPMQRGTGGGGVNQDAQQVAAMAQSAMKGSMRGTPGSRGPQVQGI